MEKVNIFRDIAERTGGDIYLGAALGQFVPGPVLIVGALYIGQDQQFHEFFYKC